MAVILAAVWVGQTAVPAVAATGGAGLPPSGSDAAPRAPKRPARGNGGYRYHAPDRARPVLTRLSISRRSLFAFGRPVQISFVIRDSSTYVRTRVAFVRVGSRHSVYTAPLGRIRTGVAHTLRWRGTEGRQALRPGHYRVRVFARDRAGNPLRRRGASSRARTIVYETHRFPLIGPHSFGGPDARFGARRPGHTHQGQDVIAAEGTPIVAPRGGTVSERGYQAGGAGYYLVLDAAGEDFDYAFMHLRAGSFGVSKGERVATGQRLGDVGQTGDATGPHLHFEIWRGVWYDGGHPIDPLPALRSWDRFS